MTVRLIGSLGIPNGGEDGQVLGKASDIDYDVRWIDAPADGGSGLPTGSAGGFLAGSYPNPGVNEAALANSTAVTDAKNRANHTGTQDISTVTGLAAVAGSGAYADLSGKPTIPPAYTDEQVRDVMGIALVAGDNVTITPSDAGDTITIAATSATDADVAALVQDPETATGLALLNTFTTKEEAPEFIAAQESDVAEWVGAGGELDTALSAAYVPRSEYGLSIVDNGDGTLTSTSTAIVDNGDGTLTAA